MATFLSNWSSRVICVRQGIIIPGGGFNYVHDYARLFRPCTYLVGISHRESRKPRVLQHWPGTEMGVELWLEGYGYKKTVKLEAAGGIIMAYDISNSVPDGVTFIYIEYMPGTLRLIGQKILTTIYAAHSN